ncbi:hypothetical protein SAMN04488239_10450 [Ruegeria marina]|uniref:Cold shock protein, CspA family n=2 Tax=Ruegeria marina TaxID=639004 RepID=A0A1G6QAF0_9RHOB|nr:hypothetical protein SAMN04488239_10450 [Ruegeria marina]
MFGVVLWSDTTDRKAVIWCEDHGDLAFYRQTDKAQGVRLDVGDWVQFDLVTERNQRMAFNPRLVDQGYSPGLPDLLRQADTSESMQAASHGEATGAKVVPFAPRDEKSRSKSPPLACRA